MRAGRPAPVYRTAEIETVRCEILVHHDQFGTILNKLVFICDPFSLKPGKPPKIAVADKEHNIIRREYRRGLNRVHNGGHAFGKLCLFDNGL